MRDHIRIRRFLNYPRHFYGAYVIAVVGDTSTCRKSGCDHLWCGDIQLRISDCDRVCSLDFDLDSAAARRNSLHKVTVLIETLIRFREALEIEAERAVEYERAWNQKGAASDE